MLFPGDKSPIPVPNEAVEYMKKNRGATLWRPNTMMGRPLPSTVAASWLDQAPLVGSVAGNTVGGIVGPTAGAAGGPAGAIAGGVAGRVGGGVLGGLAGKATQEAGYRALGLGDAPGSMMDEAKFQTVAGLGGEALGGLAGGAGRLLIRTGLPAKLANGLSVVENMVKERIPVGGLMKSGIPGLGTLQKGSAKAAAAWIERAGIRNRMVNDAARQGVTIPRSVVEQSLGGMAGEAKREMADDAEVSFLKRQLASWRARKGADIDPRAIQRVIVRFNAKARPILKAKALGISVPSQGNQVRANYHEAIARALTQAMEEAVPGYTEANAKLATSIATKNAVQASEAQGIRSLGSRFATGSALAGTGEYLMGERNPGRMGAGAIMGGAALASPALLSRAGLALTNEQLLWLLRNAPRTYGSQPDATGSGQ